MRQLRPGLTCHFGKTQFFLRKRNQIRVSLGLLYVSFNTRWVSRSLNPTGVVKTMIVGHWVRASGTLRATSRHWSFLSHSLFFCPPSPLHLPPFTSYIPHLSLSSPVLRHVSAMLPCGISPGGCPVPGGGQNPSSSIHFLSSPLPVLRHVSAMLPCGISPGGLSCTGRRADPSSTFHIPLIGPRPSTQTVTRPERSPGSSLARIPDWISRQMDHRRTSQRRRNQVKT